jgi:uncharacterized membrane protein YphA (DoxX/SURF4 family)
MNETPSAAAPAKSKARFVTITARFLMALAFLPAGAMYFLGMMPEPKEPPPKAMMDFAMALMNTGYLFGLIKGVELIAGLMFLIGRFVPLALVIIAPVLVNIALANIKLAPAPAGVITSVVLIVLWLYLAWAHRAAAAPLLTAKHVSQP